MPIRNHRPVLVTGATGNTGTALLTRLAERGTSVRADECASSPTLRSSLMG